MKTRVIIAACILMATVSFAQNQKINEIEVVAPKFKSELYQSVNEYLSNNFEYPGETKNIGLQGTEVVQFIVTPNGDVKDYKIINSVSPDADRELIRVLEATNGKWEPGTTNGNPVNMKTEVSVAFFLHSAEDMVKKARNYQQKGNTWMFEKNNPEKAIKFYNRGIVLLPNEESLLAMRSLCYYQLGNEKEARHDWERINTLSETNNTTPTIENIMDLNQNIKGFAQMIKTINK